MYGLVLTLHLIICLSLVGVVLVQSGKGGGLAGGAFGSSAQTTFGGRGATDFFTRATMVLGGAFFLTSLTLALMSSGNTTTTRGSLIQSEAKRSATGAPGQGGATPPAGTSIPAPGQTAAPVKPAVGAPKPAPAPAPVKVGGK